MWELTKRIPVSLRTSSVLSKVEPEADLNTGYGSDQKVPAPAPQHWLGLIFCRFRLMVILSGSGVASLPIAVLKFQLV